MADNNVIQILGLPKDRFDQLRRASRQLSSVHFVLDTCPNNELFRRIADLLQPVTIDLEDVVQHVEVRK